MLTRRGARTKSYGTPFLGRRNLLRLSFPVVRVKLRFSTISMIMRPMSLPSSAIACKRDYNVITGSLAAVRPSNLDPAFLLAEKLSAMFCVSRVTRAGCTIGQTRQIPGASRFLGPRA